MEDGGWKMKDETTRGHKRGHEGRRTRGYEDRKPECFGFGVSSMGKADGRRRAAEGRGVA
jgi:hypothetical protein